MLFPGEAPSSGKLRQARTSAFQVDRYARADWQFVSALLSASPFRPLAGLSDWSVDDLRALYLARAQAILDNAQTAAWLLRSSDRGSGLASVTPLPWDSKQLGVHAARLGHLVASGGYDEQYDKKRTLLVTALKHAEREDIHHLSVRVDASDLSGLHILESAGFITVDGILKFYFDLNAKKSGDGHRVQPAGLRLRLAAGVDAEAVAELARSAYLYDRFHADPLIAARRADALHADWLRNSCAGAAADAVLLAEDKTGLLGFVTCKLQHDTRSHLGKSVGTIVMVATADRARAKGIGRALTVAALDWFREHQTGIVEAGTQLRNIPGIRLYQGCGFRLFGSSVSLRKDFRR
jgi:ribosomal protein S18 acetylase RimI-like enzyme